MHMIPGFSSPSQRALEWLGNESRKITWKTWILKICHCVTRSAPQEISYLKQRKAAIQDAQQKWKAASAEGLKWRRKRDQQAGNTSLWLAQEAMRKAQIEAQNATHVLERTERYARRAKNCNRQAQTEAQELPLELKNFLLEKWEPEYHATLDSIANITTPEERGNINHLEDDRDEILQVLSIYRNKKKWIQWRLQTPGLSKHKKNEIRTVENAALNQKFINSINKIFSTHPLEIEETRAPYFTASHLTSIPFAALNWFRKRNQKIQRELDQLTLADALLKETLTTLLNNLFEHSEQLLRQTFQGQADATWKQSIFLIQRLEWVWALCAQRIDEIIQNFRETKMAFSSSQSPHKHKNFAHDRLNFVRQVKEFLEEEVIAHIPVMYRDSSFRTAPVNERF